MIDNLFNKPLCDLVVYTHTLKKLIQCNFLSIKLYLSVNLK